MACPGLLYPPFLVSFVKRCVPTRRILIEYRVPPGDTKRYTSYAVGAVPCPRLRGSVRIQFSQNGVYKFGTMVVTRQQVQSIVKRSIMRQYKYFRSTLIARRYISNTQAKVRIKCFRGLG